jgi:hypothetical protein
LPVPAAPSTPESLLSVALVTRPVDEQAKSIELVKATTHRTTPSFFAIDRD